MLTARRWQPAGTLAAVVIILTQQAGSPHAAAAQVLFSPDSVRLGSLGPPVVSVDLILVSPGARELDSIHVDLIGELANRQTSAFGTSANASSCGALASLRRTDEGARLEYRWPRAPGDLTPVSPARCHLGMYAIRLQRDTARVLVARAALYLVSGTTIRYDGPPDSERPALRITVTRPERSLGITVLSASLLAAGLAMLLWLARAGSRRDRV